MSEPCLWPNGTCQVYIKHTTKPDPWGRVWMHCEEGLNMSKASLSRLMTFVLQNNIELGSISASQPRYSRSAVYCAVRLKPEQFEAFERETGGKLREPPKVNLNCGGIENE